MRGTGALQADDDAAPLAQHALCEGHDVVDLARRQLRSPQYCGGSAPRRVLRLLAAAKQRIPPPHQNTLKPCWGGGGGRTSWRKKRSWPPQNCDMAFFFSSACSWQASQIWRHAGHMGAHGQGRPCGYAWLRAARRQHTCSASGIAASAGVEPGAPRARLGCCDRRAP